MGRCGGRGHEREREREREGRDPGYWPDLLAQHLRRKGTVKCNQDNATHLTHLAPSHHTPHSPSPPLHPPTSVLSTSPPASLPASSAPTALRVPLAAPSFSRASLVRKPPCKAQSATEERGLGREVVRGSPGSALLLQGLVREEAALQSSIGRRKRRKSGFSHQVCVYEREGERESVYVSCMQDAPKAL